MSDLLRVYDPTECGIDGAPLDWERCRSCAGKGYTVDMRIPRVGPRSALPEGCPACAERGSLKVAALWEYGGYGPTKIMQIRLPDDHVFRCEGCGHPMSEGTWEDDGSGILTAADRLRSAAESLRARCEPVSKFVHYSPCDEGCRHGGPQRIENEVEKRWDMTPTTNEDLLRAARASAFSYGWAVEASWRSVEVRRGMVGRRGLGDRFDPMNVFHVRPWDLRPENLAVLCLRCWAERVP